MTAMIFFRKIIFILILSVCIVTGNISLFAQEAAATDSFSVRPYLLTQQTAGAVAQKVPTAAGAEKNLAIAREQQNTKAEIRALLGMSESNIAKGKNRKAFSDLRRLLNFKHLSDDTQSVSRFYYNAGVVLARLKNYPLAMSCFYKAGAITSGRSVSSGQNFFRAMDSAGSMRSEMIPDNQDEDNEVTLFPDSAVNASLEIVAADSSANTAAISPQPIEAESILDAFDDGKKARTYAVAIHVKQPAPGENKTFAGLGEVGHMFITLIKYNKDQSVVCRTFGFYPEHGMLFSANPLFPTAPQLIKNDSTREWDEMVGRFINKRHFKKILGFIDAASERSYNLSKFNCSDFALGIAQMASIRIDDTKGSWPLGGGNNPGSAGYSILGGKFRNTETGNRSGLFAITDHLFAKE